jgi:hypothetical protein
MFISALHISFGKVLKPFWNSIPLEFVYTSKHYGIHGHDIPIVAGPSGNANFVHVDPRHANLDIYTVRQHATPVPQ